MTSMVVTHEMGFARRAANKILFMEDGEIIDRANTDDFFAGNVSERAQRFLTQILH
jgi:polar amino acid transport system ATP-binding protein